jgi:hypothetical protein
MYRIPRSDEVGETIIRVLEEYREVGSQNLLHSLVLRRLKRENQFYKLSPERVKRIAAGLAEVKIFVEKKKSGREAKKCYVCGSKMEWIEGKNLFGNAARTGKKCVKCGFRVDRPELAPRRYVFYKR